MATERQAPMRRDWKRAALWAAAGLVCAAGFFTNAAWVLTAYQHNRVFSLLLHAVLVVASVIGVRYADGQVARCLRRR